MLEPLKTGHEATLELAGKGRLDLADRSCRLGVVKEHRARLGRRAHLLFLRIDFRGDQRSVPWLGVGRQGVGGVGGALGHPSHGRRARSQTQQTITN